MKVARYPLSRAVWEDIAPLIGDAFFVSVGFSNLWRTLGGTPVYWLAKEHDEILAVLPGVEFGNRPFRRFLCMPNGCYGRLFFCNSPAIDRDRITTSLMDTLSGASYLKVFIYDFYNCLPSHKKFSIEECQTTLVDISSPDWQPPDKKLRQQIRKAEREGINIERFDLDKHLPRFLHLVKLTEKRIGSPSKYTAAFFKALASLAREDNRVRWIWCEHKGEPVSSNIFFIEHDSLLHWQSYFNEAFSYMQPHKYIPFTVAREVAQEGITYLNLGASPENVPGVEYYKSKWGGSPRFYNCHVRRTILGRLL
jgi:hypothetical protein